MAPQARLHGDRAPSARGGAGRRLLRDIEGYGVSQHIHTTRILSLSEDLPVAIIIVDAAERISEFFPSLDELITEGLIIIDDVEVIKYAGRAPGDPPQ